MNDYKPNSHRARDTKKENDVEEDDRKKIEKVVKGTVKLKKKSKFQEFVSEFIAEDVRNVKDYIIKDLIIPTIKNTILDIITDSAQMMFNGGESRASKRRTSTGSRASYSAYFDSPANKRTTNNRPVRGMNTVAYNDVIFDNRGEAEDVLNRMDEILDHYGMVSIADVYDMVGLSGPYTNNKYGWTDLRSANVIRLSDGGYMIKLPRPTLLV